MKGEVADWQDQDQSRLHIDDVARYLTRHGVKSTKPLRPMRLDRSQANSSASRESKRADLIVAGPYGHNRLGEWLLEASRKSSSKRARCAACYHTDRAPQSSSPHRGFFARSSHVCEHCLATRPCKGRRSFALLRVLSIVAAQYIKTEPTARSHKQIDMVRSGLMCIKAPPRSFDLTPVRNLYRWGLSCSRACSLHSLSAPR
jgi:hypothetical protein